MLSSGPVCWIIISCHTIFCIKLLLLPLIIRNIISFPAFVSDLVVMCTLSQYGSWHDISLLWTWSPCGNPFCTLLMSSPLLPLDTIKWTCVSVLCWRHHVLEPSITFNILIIYIWDIIYIFCNRRYYIVYLGHHL